MIDALASEDLPSPERRGPTGRAQPPTVGSAATVQCHKPSRRQVLAGAAGLVSFASVAATARASASGEPIKIGVITEASTLEGAAIPKGAQMAADEINQAGGVLGRPLKLVVYDDHESASQASSAFQRLKAEDHVVAVLASFMSEIALALAPWSARLRTPFATPGASSNVISEQVHKDYDRFKYTFHAYFTSYFMAKSTSESARDLLVEQLHMRSAAIMSEDAAWTTSLDAAYLEFLPRYGLDIVDHVRFAPDTTDFTPIFNRIAAKKPDVIMTGFSHVGVVPTVQWTQARMPIPMYGVSSQASSGAFWKDTHGFAEGISDQSDATPTSAITPKTVPFSRAYEKRFGLTPAFAGYSAYDAIHVFAEAIERARSTDPDKMVTGLEATDHLGTIGRIQFYGRQERFTHAIKFGIDLVPGVMLQWQRGRMQTIWPLKFATAAISFPPFVTLPA